MTETTKRSLLNRLFERRADRRKPRRRAMEPADMGTALGLEHTLDQPLESNAALVRPGRRSWMASLRNARAVG